MNRQKSLDLANSPVDLSTDLLGFVAPENCNGCALVLQRFGDFQGLIADHVNQLWNEIEAQQESVTAQATVVAGQANIIADLRNTVDEQAHTIAGQANIIADLRNTVDEQAHTIAGQANIIADLRDTVDEQAHTITVQGTTMAQQQATLDQLAWDRDKLRLRYLAVRYKNDKNRDKQTLKCRLKHDGAEIAIAQYFSAPPKRSTTARNRLAEIIDWGNESAHKFTPNEIATTLHQLKSEELKSVFTSIFMFYFPDASLEPATVDISDV